MDYHDLNQPWYTLPKEEMGEAVKRLVDQYKSEQVGRRGRYVHNRELYERRRLGGYSAHTYYTPSAEDWDNDELDRLGLVRSAVTTAVSTIYAPQKPKPQFQTLGATWALKRKAYKLDRICEGVLHQKQGRWNNVWAFLVAEACPEASLQGCCAIKVTADVPGKRICHTVVPLPDLFVDPSEGRNPRSLFERAPISQSEALRLAKGKAEAISAIKGAPEYDWYARTGATKPRADRTIEAIYAWHLPDGAEEPGTWCVVVGGYMIEHGEWTAPDFPFVFLVWEPQSEGFWGTGIADEGGKLAQEAGDYDHRLHHRAIIASCKHIYYYEGTVKPDDLALNDAVVGVPVTEGMQFPQETVIPPFGGVELELREQKIRSFWDLVGISQVSAAARREPGVESGVAMMTLNDTKAGRHLAKGQRYEQLFPDLAHQYMWRFREIAEEHPDFEATWPGSHTLRTIKWRELDLRDDMFTITVDPAAMLPHDPAGRQQMIQALLASQLISKESAKSLIGMPDLDAELAIENAEGEYVDSLIERYLDAKEDSWSSGDYEAPEGHMMNKGGALRRFSAAWFRARVDQASLPRPERAKAEFNIQLLGRWIKELDALMTPVPPTDQVPPAPEMAAAVPPAPPPAAPTEPAPPIGPPMALPPTG